MAEPAQLSLRLNLLNTKVSALLRTSSGTLANDAKQIISLYPLLDAWPCALWQHGPLLWFTDRVHTCSVRVRSPAPSSALCWDPSNAAGRARGRRWPQSCLNAPGQTPAQGFPDSLSPCSPPRRALSPTAPYQNPVPSLPVLRVRPPPVLSPALSCFPSSQAHPASQVRHPLLPQPGPSRSVFLFTSALVP